MFSHQAKYRILKTILGPLLLSGMRIRVVHKEKFPSQGPTLLLCNHRSPLDALIVSANNSRYISWVVADYMMKDPINGWAFKTSGMIPASVTGKLTRSALAGMLKVLEQGQVLGIFPEGQDYIFKGDYQQGLANFYSGFAYLAQRTKATIAPCVLRALKEKLEPLRLSPGMRREIILALNMEPPDQQLKYQQVDLIYCDPVAPHIYERKTQNWLKQYCRELMTAAQISI